MIDPTKYPLSWPPGWPRTAPEKRRPAAFWRNRNRVDIHGAEHKSKEALSVGEAIERLLIEFARMDIDPDAVTVSTNVEPRLDGYPKARSATPLDPGVAVYWRDGKISRVMAIDRYNRLADNIAAVAASLEALRLVERHGGSVILDRAFAGFSALPAPGQSSRTWRDVLGIERGAKVTETEIEARYMRLRSAHHPDHGGSADGFVEVQQAYESGLEEIRGA